ncbi:MAG TPA: patatin-like phospholipase family protein [Candidatus Paceibacterota bacterium]|nr:patatin-like phospholipase family protein [Candidatus Paceibacterota bacterium]
MAKKIGLALGGGSALGNAHLGVLQSFADHGIPIDCIAGTSAGAVVAACYAFGVSIEKMQSAAEQLNWRAISKFLPSKLGIISNEALANVLEDVLGGDRRIEKADMPLAIVATDVGNGEKVVFRSGSVFAAVRASAAIPIIFTPVMIGDKCFVDGGIVENVPMSGLAEMGADIRIGVNLTHWMSHEMPKNMLDVMEKSIRIMSRYDVPPGDGDIMIVPRLDEYTSSDFQKGREIAAHGYRAATLKIPEIKRLIGARESESLFRQFSRWFRG